MRFSHGIMPNGLEMSARSMDQAQNDRNQTLGYLQRSPRPQAGIIDGLYRELEMDRSQANTGRVMITCARSRMMSCMHVELYWVVEMKWKSKVEKIWALCWNDSWNVKWNRKKIKRDSQKKKNKKSRIWLLRNQKFSKGRWLS